MYRYQNVQYNGIYLSEICDVEEVKLPVLPSRTLSSLDIASRDGEVYNGKKYNSCTIEVTVLIDCDTRKEAKEKLKEQGLEIEYEKNEGETIDEKEEVICEQLPKQGVKVKQGNKVMVQISK